MAEPGYYKPDHRCSLLHMPRWTLQNEEMIYVAMGQFAELKDCYELGIRSVWINRDDETPNPALQSDVVLKDLSGLRPRCCHHDVAGAYPTGGVHEGSLPAFDRSSIA